MFVKRTYRQLFLGMTGTLFGAYLATCLYLYFYQRHLIFSPKKSIETLPNAPRFRLPYQEIWISIRKSSEHLNAWWIQAKSRSPHQGKVILYFPGRSGNKGDNLFRAEGFHQIGFSVLTIDYRGFGNSGGNFPSERQVYEDASAAWLYLTKKCHISPKNIYIYGESLGGAVAIDLAVKHPDAGGVIVQSSFTSMVAVAKKQANWLSFLPLQSIVTEKFDSLSKISKLKIPVLFLHGTGDKIVPYSMSQQLYKAAPQPKSILLIPDKGHIVIYKAGKDSYLQAIEKLVANND
jgi:uncharacterized protein